MKNRRDSMSRQEREIIEHGRSVGAPIAVLPDDELFVFHVTPITTNAIDVSALVKLGMKVNALAQASRFRCELASIIVFPIIANPEIYKREDFLTNKRSSQSYYVGRNIPFDKWSRSRTPRRLAMAAENFTSSILKIPEKLLPAESRQQLEGYIATAADTLNLKSA